ncbi:polysaccharide deacetylase family protein [Sulfurimonas sp. HSL-1716]|uniref:polysaccharide deacetylase family protein n=1 Tax=Hydrocurvibacter sulfurireducens TaxID=3131937 RepID=UPI0031F951C8
MNKKLTVVMYHYVRDLKNSKYPNIKGLDLKLFREQIMFFKKHYRFITMEELIFSMENQKELPPKSILLTFDDGYIDHYKNVFPVLAENKVQGSFYIPAKTVCENKVLDVNKIHFILASQVDTIKIVDTIKEQLNIYRDEYGLDSFEYYYNKLACANRFDDKDVVFVKRLLQVELDEEVRYKITDFLFSLFLNKDEQEFSDELYMSRSNIKEMLKEGMHIGCHGYDHYWWNKLSKKKLEQDLTSSLSFLQEVGVDIDNWTACFPYGSYSNEAVDILAKLNCKAAFTTDVDVADLSVGSRLLIPRLDTNDFPVDQKNDPNEWYVKG